MTGEMTEQEWQEWEREVERLLLLAGVQVPRIIRRDRRDRVSYRAELVAMLVAVNESTRKA